MIKLIVNGKEYPIQFLQNLYDKDNTGFSNKRAWHSRKFQEMETLIQTARAQIEHAIIRTPYGDFIFKKEKK